jgi:hypothetical protein
MRHILILFCISLYFGCSQHNDTSADLKSNKIHLALMKKGIYSYLKHDTFYIHDNADQEILKVHLIPPQKYPDLYKLADTTYFVKQIQYPKYLFIVLQDSNSAASFDFFLIDTMTKKVLVQDHTFYGYFGSSENGDYHAFEFGTSACRRTFAIYDSNNKLLKEAGYYSCTDDTAQLKWIGNKIFYYDTCSDKNIPLDIKNKKLKEQEVIAQKYFWTNGKDSITKDYNVVFIE